MTKTFEVVFSVDAEHDFELIFDFLFESYLSFDESVETALKQAEAKTQSVRTVAENLSKNPFRGTVHNDLLEGLRHITIGRAIYWFDILEDAQIVRILAILYGGQDHHTKILTRLLSDLDH